MFAANDGHVAVVQALLEAGADIRIKNKVSDSADTSESTRTYDWLAAGTFCLSDTAHLRVVKISVDLYFFRSSLVYVRI